MSLLPAKFQNTDDMPMSLGKAIAKAIAPKVDRIEAFNKGDHREFKNPAMPFFGFDLIDEADCKQIKGAASKDVVMGFAVASGVAPPSVQAFMVGDRVRVIAEVCKFVTEFKGREYTIVRIGESGGCYVDAKLFFWPYNIELIPAPEPARSKGRRRKTS